VPQDATAKLGASSNSAPGVQLGESAVGGSSRQSLCTPSVVARVAPSRFGCLARGRSFGWRH
jgi:hypothetical protein